MRPPPGWGNLGGGVTQFAMPLLFGAFMSYGAGAWWSWRLAMLTAGVALLLTGAAYYFLTEDTADGDWKLCAARGRSPMLPAAERLPQACRDIRVWSLALLYAASFGIELTVDNFAALYYTDNFHLSLGWRDGGQHVRHDEPVRARIGRDRQRPL